MIRYTLPLVAIAAMSQPAAAAVDVQSTGPVVQLSVTEMVQVSPDIANLSAGVTTVAPTAVEAMEQNSTQMAQVINALKAQGIDEDDIQTSGVNLSIDYVWDEQTRQQQFQGYRVTNRVNVIVRDIDDTGSVLDALVRVGANDIGGIGWSIDDPAPVQEQARVAAFASGRERALAYARMAGYSDVRLLEVSENYVASRPMEFNDQVVVTARAAPPAPPVQPGQVQAGITVNFSYEMVQ